MPVFGQRAVVIVPPSFCDTADKNLFVVSILGDVLVPEPKLFVDNLTRLACSVEYDVVWSFM